MKSTYIFLLLLLALPLTSSGQQVANAHCMNSDFENKLEKMLSGTVTQIDVEDLHAAPDSFLILDAREIEEYKVSHISGAKYIGYENWNKDVLKSIDKSTPIVLYCSIGYRSEKIGEKLQKLGFTNVQNLYGSIFEWVNRGYPVVDKDGKTTNKVHTYSRSWSKWVDHPQIDITW